jgi:hypothetical protein
MKTKRPNMPFAAALHTASQKQQNGLFCDSADHKSENCPDHNIATRKEKLKKNGKMLCKFRTETHSKIL